jgi:flagella basal body P-ring formation protein FlgA
MSKSFSNSCLYAAILIASQWSAKAAEIHFHREVAVGRGIVRLGDVAEVLTSDANEARLLEGIALIPAPSGDEPKLLKRQEVQQLLQLSGVTLREHRFSGAEVTQLRAGSSAVTTPQAAVQEASAIEQLPTTVKTEAKKPVTQQTEVPATPAGRVAHAIVAHLNVVCDMTAEWQAEVAMSPRVVQALAELPIIRVEGGISPWLGRQQFMLLVGNETAPTRLPVEAEVSGTARAVTVVRTIERGQLLAAEDIQLQTVTLQRGVAILLDPQQIVGRETTRTLNAGQVVTNDMFRNVRLVQRGETIDVFSIGAGLQISEPGKALNDGSFGDTIQVEFVDRRKMSVRVTGLRHAEVYAMQTSRSPVKNTPPSTSQLIRR